MTRRTYLNHKIRTLTRAASLESESVLKTPLAQLLTSALSGQLKPKSSLDSRNEVKSLTTVYQSVEPLAKR